MGATRRIQLKQGWCEPPVIWSVVVGESGTSKSPALALVLDPIQQLQAWKIQEYSELAEQYERDRLVYRADLAAWERNKHRAHTPRPVEPEEPVLQRYLVDDITIHALAERLQAAPRGLLAASDELATWLGSFRTGRSKSGGDVGRWLSIHQARRLTIDRKTGANKTIFIPYAAVSLTGTIQPATLRRLLGVEYFENGLAARLLLAWPPRRGRRWSDATVDADVTRRMKHLFGRLLALDFRTDANDCLAPIDLALAPPARSRWIEFFNEYACEQEDVTGPLAAAFAKLEAYAARLALLVHLVRCATDDPTVLDPDVVDAQSVSAGVTLARWFARETRRTYLMLGESHSQVDHTRLIDLIRRRGGHITANDLRRRSRRLATSEQAERALADLVDAGAGYWNQLSSRPEGGRPTREFILIENASVSGTPTITGKEPGYGYEDPHQTPIDPD